LGDIQALRREAVMDTRLIMSNRVATLVQHLRPPINPVEPLIHHTTHPLKTLTLRTNRNLNPTTHHNPLMEDPRTRSQLTARRQTPNSHRMEASNTKTLMEAINLSSTLPLLTSSHLTAHLQIPNNHRLEAFSTKIHTAAIKGHHPRNMRRPQVIQEVLDMALLLPVIFHNHNISTFKVCTMQNILVVFMAIVPALVALPFLQAPIHTRARMHLHQVNMVRLLTSTVDSRGGNLTRRRAARRKSGWIFSGYVFAFLLDRYPAVALKHLCTVVIGAAHLAEWI